jgi:hypothetical protein
VSGTGTTRHWGLGLIGCLAGCAQFPLLHDHSAPSGFGGAFLHYVNCWWRLFSVAISIIVLLSSVRCGVAMTITVAAVAGLIVGLTIGVTGTGLALMERPRRWVVCIRLSEELHRRLREEATDHMCSLKAEIINRLQASFQ